MCVIRALQTSREGAEDCGFVGLSSVCVCVCVCHTQELINRGGEKISPLEVDAALLSHPSVAEAVSFGAPDEKYGEVVAAAVVLKPGAAREGVEGSIQKHCGATLAAFKVGLSVAQA